MKLRFVSYGALFGFLLSRADATDYGAIHGMFALTDLHLYGVIGLAVAVAGLGFVAFRRFGWLTRTGEPARIEAKPWQPAVIWGGLVFGAGWAIAGACPGTSLAQIGEGRIGAIATFAGILVGAWIATRQRAPARDRLPGAAVAH